MKKVVSAMLETNEVSNQAPEVPKSLPKHTYPVSVCVLLMYIGLLCVIVIPVFLFYELPLHRALSVRIKQARRAFRDRDYGKAIHLYTELVKEHPNYTQGKRKLGMCYFAMIALQKTHDYDEILYEQGWSILPEGHWTAREIHDVAKYLPVVYQERFESSFRDLA